MTNKYFGSWDTWQDMASSFDNVDKDNVPADFPTDAEVVAASYETESYEGSSSIVYLRDGKLYESSSSHCSCNGLDWDKGAVISWEYVKERIAKGHFYGFSNEGLERLQRLAVEELNGEAMLRDFHSSETAPN